MCLAFNFSKAPERCRQNLSEEPIRWHNSQTEPLPRQHPLGSVSSGRGRRSLKASAVRSDTWEEPRGSPYSSCSSSATAPEGQDEGWFFAFPSTKHVKTITAQGHQTTGKQQFSTTCAEQMIINPSWRSQRFFPAFYWPLKVHLDSKSTHKTK